MTLNINDMIDSLAKGQEAIEALPNIKRENAELWDQLNQTEDAKRRTEQRLAEIEAKLAATEESLKIVEEAKAAATFRENSLRTQLDTFRSMVGAALGTVAEAVDAVEAKVADAAESVSQSAEGELVGTTENQSQGATSFHVDGETNAPSEPSRAPEVAPPYSGRAHWEKPSDISWHDWKSGGGEVPYWVHLESIN